jgi:hypothetical protein
MMAKVTVEAVEIEKVKQGLLELMKRARPGEFQNDVARHTLELAAKERSEIVAFLEEKFASNPTVMRELAAVRSGAHRR